ncbi:MFS transporter [Brevibacillus migulae]|uniref:MFS transporter n=1 Tax=Brevibacillus migulae TaxID=1644114 RepID=UPI00106EEDB4|nr:MFS transporter [Brevibacillus migulae]
MSMTLLRSYNFFYFSMFSVFLSFLPVYLSAQGVSKTQIGFLIAMGGLVGMFSQPLWGVVSDKTKTVKKVLLLILSASILVGTLLFQTTQLSLLILLVGLMYFFFMPTDPLTESLNFQLSQKHQINYGSVRMFGALGYACASLIIGYSSDHFGMGSMMVLFLGYGLITLLFGLALPDVPANAKKLAWKDLRAFFAKRETITFFILVFLLAIPHRLNDNFIGIYVESLGGNIRLIGQAWFLMTLVEVLFFAMSHRFVKPGNEWKVITAAGGIYAIRFYLSSIVTDPHLVVYLQLLQGVTFVLFYTAAIQYLYTIIPEEWRATGQTILAVLFFGVSGIFGSVIGGWIFEVYGGSMLYTVMAVLSLLGVAYSLLMAGRAKSRGRS